MQTSYPLHVYRVYFLGIEVYKCVNGLNLKSMNDTFVIRPNADRLRDSNRAMQPKFSSVGFGFESFKYFGAKLWNVLPITVKQSENLFIFKDRLTDWCHANRSLNIFISVVLYSSSYTHPIHIYSSLVVPRVVNSTFFAAPHGRRVLRFSRNQCVYFGVHVCISIVNAFFSFNLCICMIFIDCTRL